MNEFPVNRDATVNGGEFSPSVILMSEATGA